MILYIRLIHLVYALALPRLVNFTIQTVNLCLAEEPLKLWVCRCNFGIRKHMLDGCYCRCCCSWSSGDNGKRLPESSANFAFPSHEDRLKAERTRYGFLQDRVPYCGSTIRFDLTHRYEATRIDLCRTDTTRAREQNKYSTKKP